MTGDLAIVAISYRYRAEIACDDPTEVITWCRQHLGPWPNTGRWSFLIRRYGDVTGIIISTNDPDDHVLVSLSW